MRPEIPDELIDQIDNVASKNGYQSTGEFVRDAVRRRVNELSETHTFMFSDEEYRHPSEYHTVMVGDSFDDFTQRQNELFVEINQNDSDVIIIDTNNMYRTLCQATNGTHIPVTNNTHINPLSVSKPSESLLRENIGWLDTPIQNAMMFFEVFADLKNVKLSSEDKSVLRLAITDAFNTRGISQDGETHSNTPPVIEDVLDVLEHMMEQERREPPSSSTLEPEYIKEYAKRLRILLNDFTHAEAFKSHNNQTNIDIRDNTPCTYFSIDESLSNQQKTLKLLTLINTACEYALTSDKKTVIVIDDSKRDTEVITNLLEYNRLSQISRHARHWNASVHFMLPPVQTLFEYDEVTNIMANAVLRHD